MTIDIRNYLTLEAALINRMHKAWRSLAVPYHAAVMTAVDAGDWAGALEAAHDLDLTPMGEPNREFIKFLLLACANFGAQRAANQQVTFVSAGSHTALLTKQCDKFIAAINFAMLPQVISQTVQLIAKVQQSQDHVQKLEPDQYLKSFTSFAAIGDSMAQLISSQHSSRLSTWGFAAEAELLGVTKYKVTAVLDGRTSEFCRMINGRIFEVEDARRSINTILALDNYDDVKNVQPWPNQSQASIKEFKEMTNTQLVERNLHIPPYHPHCRTLLTLVKNAPRLQKPEIPDSTMVPSVSTPDTFKEMGLDLTPEQIAHWNDYVGLNPVEVSAKLKGVSPTDIVMGQAGTQTLTVEDDGDISIKSTQPVGNGTAKFHAIYDPYGSNFYLDYLTTRNAVQADAVAYAQSFYTGLFEVSENIGAESITVVADSIEPLSFYLQKGFQLTASDWFTFKEAILANDPLLTRLQQALLPSDYATVVAILASKDQEGMFALSMLPFTVEGTRLLDVLLDGQAFVLTWQAHTFPQAQDFA